MKRFLMLNYFFPPMGDGGVFRSLKLARYLPENGWLPRVVCGRPEDYWLRDDSLLAELPRGISVERVGGLTGQALLRRIRRGAAAGTGGGSRSSGLFTKLRAFGDLFLLPDSYSPWIPAALAAGRRALAAGDVELLYSSSPPDSSHIVARRLAGESGLPWVADFRDPWFNLHLKTPPTPLHRALLARMEARTLREAQVVAVTEGWRRYYASRAQRPPILIRNGYDPEDFASLPPYSPDPAGRLRILHTGKLSITRSSGPFLQGLADLLRDEPQWRDRLEVRFVGARESDNEAAASRLGLDGIVSFSDPVSHAESVALQARADLLLLVKHDDPRYRDLVPGKFYEYAATGRPIFAVTPHGEIETLMEDYELGWCVGPRPEAIRAQLASALAQVAAGWAPARGGAEELTRPHQAARMAALFDEICAEHARRTEGAGR